MPTPPPPGAVDMAETAPPGGVAHALLDVADRIDAFLYGKRTAILIGLSFAVVGVSFWETARTPRDLRLTAIFAFLLALYLQVLFLARIGSFRDDARRWSATLVKERFAAWWGDLKQSVSELGELPGSEIARAVGRFIAGASLVVLALRTVFVLLRVTLAELFSVRSTSLESLGENVLLVGGIGFVGGLLIWLLGYLRSRTGQGAESLEVHEADRAALSHAAEALPPVLELSQPAVVNAALASMQHPLFRELLRTLADWRPRGHSTEAAYALSLERKLRQRMPGAAAEREKPIASLDSGRRRLRADLVIGDAVLVEMKRGFNTSTAQKAVGQVRMYAQAWRRRGPVLLLICGAERRLVEELLKNELPELRQAGVVVAVRP